MSDLIVSEPAAAYGETKRTPQGGEPWLQKRGWTEEEYLALGTNQLIEFNNGVLEILPMPDFLHQRMGRYLANQMEAFVNKNGRCGVAATSPFKLKLPNMKRYREPDVLFLFAENAHQFANEFWTGADLVVEIVSPGGERRDLVEKRADYALAGVPEYWIIDPSAETLTVLILNGTEYVEHGVFLKGQRATSVVLDGFGVCVDTLLGLRVPFPKNESAAPQLNMPLETLTLSPIGTIHTPFRDRADAPRQPRARRDPSEGIIVLLPGLNFEQALEDLDGFEFIWIVSWFHKNTNWKPKVLPPRGSAVKRGVFATRSPYRPNPIGLSLGRLLEIKGRTVRVAETDLIDGTPILDIKPYLSFAEAYPDAGVGWLESLRHDRESHYAVEWTDLAREQSTWLIENFEINLCKHGERVLSRNIAPHPYRRIAKNGGGILELAIKSWRLLFVPKGAGVEVKSIASGYSTLAMNTRDPNLPLHDEAAHIAFHARWPEVADRETRKQKFKQ